MPKAEQADSDVPQPHQLPDLDQLDGDEQTREVYAWAGLALYYAQVFEHGLVNLIHVVLGTRNQLVGQYATIDEFYEQKFRKMMGKLLEETRKLGVLPDEALDLASRAVARRNFLIHEFFRERVELFPHQEGRRLLLIELSDAVGLFMRADAAVDQVVFALGAPAGITREAVALRAEQLRRDTEPPS